MRWKVLLLLVRINWRVRRWRAVLGALAAVLCLSSAGILLSSSSAPGNLSGYQDDGGLFYLAGDKQWRLRQEARARRLMADSRPSIPTEKDTTVNWTDINCDGIDEIENRNFVAAGWTKAVYSGHFRRMPVAVKIVNTRGHDFEKCLAETSTTRAECYRKSAAKILKEIVLLKELVHDNMLKVLGYCIPKGDFSEETGNTVAMVTELGNPVDIIKLLQMSWEDRLRISLGVARLLHHLAHSSLGSLAMNDFRRQQFVIINGEVKLSDVDDVGVDEPTCVDDTPCTLPIPAANSSLLVPCVQGLCKGYNEMQNIAKAGRHFTTFLLPHGAPENLKSHIEDLVTAYNTLKWDSRRILEHTEKIANLFTSGKYLERSARSISGAKGFKMFASSDLPGEFDYRCQLSLSSNGCTLSVFDIHEAQDICLRDPDCQAFVMTQESTWTGRKIVHFKSNYSHPVWNAGTDLYIKVPSVDL